jgi:hypothetical protein
MHFSADQSPVTFEKRQQFKKFPIPDSVAVPRDEAARERFRVARLEIHCEKRNFRGHIAGPEFRAELQTIKNLNPIARETNVFTMQISMAIPDPTFSRARDEPVPMLFNKASPKPIHLIQFAPRHRVAGQRTDIT